MLIYPHQEATFAELRNRAELYFSGKWQRLPIKPRFHSLLVGSTGTGKTALGTNLAEKMNAHLHRISVSDWIPLGANNRGAKETLCTICKTVMKSKRTVIFLDELDKISGDSTWLTHVRTEIFDLLDAHLPPGMDFDDLLEDESFSDKIDQSRVVQKVEERLRNKVFIVAAGAFQGFFEQERSVKIGFSDPLQGSLIPEIDATDIARHLPRELSNRFHSKLLILHPLKATDYLQIATSLAAALPEELRIPFSRSAQRMIPDAVKTQKGCRFLEEALLEAMQSNGQPVLPF